MKAKLDMNIKAYSSRCIGIIIDSITYTGKIVKVNKCSFIVKFNHMTVKHGSKITNEIEHEYGIPVKFTYWKTTSDGRELYKSNGNLYGCIEL